MKKLGLLAEDERLHHPDILAGLSEGYELHDYGHWRQWDHPTLLERCRAVEVIVTGRKSPRLPDELAGNFGSLRYLCHLHGTIRHLASKKLVEAGLIVTNWGDAVESVAEGAMALLLCQLKQLRGLDAISRGRTDPRIYQNYPPTLKKNHVGLYGFGPIGRHMARLLEPFEPVIHVYDPYATDLPRGVVRVDALRDLFVRCPIISIHCGLNDQTRDSVNGELLDLLPQGGIVINTARGGIVDETALAQRVAEGRLLAGLDVIRDESNWSAGPLSALPGVLLTKHKVSSGKGYPPGQEPAPSLPEHTRHNLRAYREGQPLINVITPRIYDLKT